MVIYEFMLKLRCVDKDVLSLFVFSGGGGVLQRVRRFLFLHD